MRTGPTGRFSGSTGVSARTYHRDRRGRFASAGGAFRDRFSGAKTGDDALAAAPVAFDEQPGTDKPALVRGLDDYQGTVIPDAVAHYTGLGHNTVNGGLRGQRELSDRDHRTIDGLSMAMRRSHLTADVIVHRGMRLPSSQLGSSWDPSGDMTGRSWRDAGFSSTSASPHVASGFAYREGRSDTVVVAQILVPKGTPAVTLGSDESEMLLPSRTTFTVVADHGTGDNGVRRLDLIASYDRDS